MAVDLTKLAGSEIGIFRLQNLISARGGTSVVYEAIINNDALYTHRKGTRVALKIMRMDPRKESNQTEFENMIRRETDLLNRFRHPGILRIFSLNRHKSGDPYRSRATEVDPKQPPWYIAMELLPGQPVSKLRLKRYALSWRVELLYQIAVVLEYLHSRGYGHLDLKPENILFRENPDKKTVPQPVLIDFGLTTHLAEPPPRAATLTHCSPERLQWLQQNRKNKNQLPAGVSPKTLPFDYLASDVWSFGVLCYEVLNERYLYQNIKSGKTNDSMQRTGRTVLAGKIVHQAPDPMDNDVPPLLGQLVEAMLDPDPETRPTINDIIDYLETSIELASPRL
jgi:eukaryotic-like serine/threonine-protein kinase